LPRLLTVGIEQRLLSYKPLDTSGVFMECSLSSMLKIYLLLILFIYFFMFCWTCKISKLTIGVSVIMYVCLSHLSLCGPVMNWWPIQGVPCLSPNDSWDRLQPPLRPWVGLSGYIKCMDRSAIDWKHLNHQFGCSQAYPGKDKANTNTSGQCSY